MHVLGEVKKEKKIPIHPHKDGKERATPHNKREREILRIVELCKEKENPALPPKWPRSGVTFQFCSFKVLGARKIHEDRSNKTLRVSFQP